MNTYLKLAAAAAAVVIVAIAGYRLLPSTVGPGAGASPSPSAGTSIPVMGSGILEPGTYLTTPVYGSPLQWQLTVPEGWSGADRSGLFPTALGIAGTGSGAPDGLVVAFLSSPEVVLDGCDLAGGYSDTSTVAELVAAIQAQAEWVVSAPTDVTLGGFPGKRLDVQLPADISRCGQDHYMVFGKPGTGTQNGWEAQGPGQELRVWVLDVAGAVVIVQRASFAATPAKELAEADRIIESSVITP